MLIPDSLVNELVKNPVFKTDTRAIFFLLQNPEPVSFDVIADATGVSRKCVNRSIKRLTEAGLIQPGEVQPRTQRFNVTGWEHLQPPTVTEKNDSVQSGDFESRFNRLEAMILNMVDSSGAVSGQNLPGIVLRPAGDEPLQDKLNPLIIPNGTELVSIGIGSGQNESETDPSIIRAQELEKQQLALKASFVKEKANSSFSDTYSPAHVGDEFKALFGVNVPVGFMDMAAVETMVNRKKSGKLDNVKSPLAYLASLAGKVSPIVPSSVNLNNEIRMSVQPTSESLPVNARLSHDDISRINDLWDAMTGEQRMPYETAALPKFEKQVGRYKVPIHLLAKSVFNNEQVRNMGGRI